MNRIVASLYIFMVYLSVLPAGTIYGIPVKIGLIALIVLLLLCCKRKVVVSKYIIYILSISAIMFAVWAPIAAINGYETTIFSFMKSYIALIAVIVITVILTDNKILEKEKVFFAIKCASWIIIVFKIALELLVMFRVVSWDAVAGFLTNVLNAQYMYLPIQLGPFVGYRISFTNDTLPYICYSLDFIYNHNRRGSKVLVDFLLLFLYSLISYSRMLIAQFFAITLIGLIFWIKSHPSSKQARAIIFLILVIGIGVTCFSRNDDSQFLTQINSLFSTRFSGKQVEFSDNTRKEQKSYLVVGIDSHPLFGNGLGSYIKKYIRSNTLPYSYELEYLSFIYQFGIIGFGAIFLSLILIFWQLIFRVRIRKEVSKPVVVMLLINFVFWLIRPILNPYFLSSSSGMTISFMILVAKYYSVKETDLTKQIELAPRI